MWASEIPGDGPLKDKLQRICTNSLLLPCLLLMCDRGLLPPRALGTPRLRALRAFQSPSYRSPKCAPPRGVVSCVGAQVTGHRSGKAGAMSPHGQDLLVRAAERQAGGQLH